MAHTPHRRVILDMDSSESPVHGQQEGAAYNGHFECVCYHPLFLFNQFGDCEGAMLGSGNVPSADGWQELLEPVVNGYQKKGLRLLFRGDAAFARPELYEYLEERKIGYAIRLPANQVRLWLFILSYNLGNFVRRLALPESMKHWTLTSIQTRLIKIGGGLVRHSRRLVFQLAEVLVTREMLTGILERISWLRLAPG